MSSGWEIFTGELNDDVIGPIENVRSVGIFAISGLSESRSEPPSDEGFGAFWLVENVKPPQLPSFGNES